jgi:hypothetical protein
MGGLLRRRLMLLRHRTRSFVGQYPAVYLPFAQWKRRRHLNQARRSGVQPEWAAPVDRDTDAVIEGFPRSANTFAATAFELAQRRSVRVARHRHVPAQIIAGTRWRIPTMVLVRDPEEAIISLAIWTPAITLAQSLKDYIRFYRRVYPFREGFIVARFEEITTDFGMVVRRFNERFGTMFDEFEHTSENVCRCFDIMEDHARIKTGRIGETRIGRPSPEREAMKQRLRAAFRSTELAGLRTEAYGLYEAFSSTDN